MSSELTTILLLANVAATLFMVGLIWFVQVVHYPLFAQAGVCQFATYHAAHRNATTRLVGLPMLVEAITAAALAWQPPSQSLATACWGGLVLVVVLWLSTAALHVPMHSRLSCGFDPSAHRALVSRNWIRSTVWSIRGALMLYVLSQALTGGVGHGS